MIAAAARRGLEALLGERVRFDVPMARFTSLRVGGPADAVAEPADRAELLGVLRLCASHRLPHTLIGAGFNTLCLDGALGGVLLHLGRLRRLEERPGRLVRAEAGVSHSQVANFCMQRGFAGLEFAAGVPGTVGGWIAMNAGIPGREVGDIVREVEVASPAGGQIRHLAREALHFRYRALRGLAAGSVIVSALLAVELSTPAAVRAEVERLLERRARTQPLSVPSCGSVFKNPPGEFAGRLIESVGLKGRRIGGAEISKVHANFIANVGRASAGDVLALMDEARACVLRATGRRLEPEVRIVGRAPTAEGSA
ncbi:MAG: UDP-N-acetylmuramate dehydrogenase [Myxococcales bacterium]|nr:MAG: UDP-N-acetylmuramate dehydrogenase [Myxococcales bacterium]